MEHIATPAPTEYVEHGYFGLKPGADWIIDGKRFREVRRSGERLELELIADRLVRVWDKDWNLVGPIEEADLRNPNFSYRDFAEFDLSGDHAITSWLIANMDYTAHLTVDRPGELRWCGALSRFNIGREADDNLVCRTRWTDALYGLRRLQDMRLRLADAEAVAGA